MLTVPGVRSGSGHRRLQHGRSFPTPSKSLDELACADVNAVPIETARRGGKMGLARAGGARASPVGWGRATSAIGCCDRSNCRRRRCLFRYRFGVEARRARTGRSSTIRCSSGGARMRTSAPTSLSTAADPKAPQTKENDKIPMCPDGVAQPPAPDSAEVTLGMEWPKESEMADFRYLAIVDSCGNARVQPFQRTFTVPVFEVASGGCGKPDGKVLRVFPEGGWIRITAFNLDAPATDNVINVTYRVNLPALENSVESNPAKLLFPDLLLQDLQIDCGPALRKAPTDAIGIPGSCRRAQKTASSPPQAPPPPRNNAGGKPGQARMPQVPPFPPPMLPAPMPPMQPPPKRELPAFGARCLRRSRTVRAAVIAPEPLKQGGYCHWIRLARSDQATPHRSARALYVRLTRTDVVRTRRNADRSSPKSVARMDHHAPSNPEFQLPPLAAGFDGDSRLRLDRVERSAERRRQGRSALGFEVDIASAPLAHEDTGDERRKGARRMVGSLTIHSVPLLRRVRTSRSLDSAGNCLRVYLTHPRDARDDSDHTCVPWVENAARHAPHSQRDRRRASPSTATIRWSAKRFQSPRSSEDSCKRSTTVASGSSATSASHPRFRCSVVTATRHRPRLPRRRRSRSTSPTRTAPTKA